MGSALRSSFKAEVRRGERLVRRETYAVEVGNRFVEVAQSYRTEDRPDVLVRRTFVARPWGFERVVLSMSGPAGEARAEAECEQGRELAFVTHLGRRGGCKVATSRGFTLFDGQGPLFDYVNAFLVLGVCEGESVEHRVNRLDVESGLVEAVTYTFRRTRSSLEIAKPGLLAEPARLTTPDGDVALLAYEADGESFTFTPIDDAAGVVRGAQLLTA